MSSPALPSPPNAPAAASGAVRPRTAAAEHGRGGAPPPPAPGTPVSQPPASEPLVATAAAAAEPFWRTTPLDRMTAAQWESLCDGCGRCCLVKLEDADTGAIHHTDVSCTLFDARGCRCRDYPNRQARVPDCVKLKPAHVARPENGGARLTWLPPTCAYLLVADGVDLPWWHPLVSGDPETVVAAGVSVRGRVAATEDDVPLHAYPDRVVSWPGRWPKAARRRAPSGGG